MNTKSTNGLKIDSSNLHANPEPRHVRFSRETFLGEQERRQNPRVAAHVQVRRFSSEGYFIEEELINLSRSGFCLRTTHFSLPGTVLELMLQLPGTLPEIAVRAYVTYLTSDSPAEESAIDDHQEEKPAWFRLGLYLSFIEPLQKSILSRFIAGEVQKAAKADVQDLHDDPGHLRIWVDLDGLQAVGQLQQLNKVDECGLMMDVTEPLSIFDAPTIALRNPLTDLSHQLPTGEILEVKVLAAPGVPGRFYRLHLKFPPLSRGDRLILSRMLAGLN